MSEPASVTSFDCGYGLVGFAGDESRRGAVRYVGPDPIQDHRRAAEQRDEIAALHVWMAPAWQEIIWRAAQRSLAVMCPACWCSPGGLLALMGCANRVLIIQTGSMSHIRFGPKATVRPSAVPVEITSNRRRETACGKSFSRT